MRLTLKALAGATLVARAGVLAEQGRTNAGVVAFVLVVLIGVVVITMLVRLRRSVTELEKIVKRQARSSARVKAALKAAGIEVEDAPPEEE